MFYILDDAGNPLRVSPTAWAGWLEASRADDRRRVAYDVVDADGAIAVMVSTVFLGFDHRFVGSGPPLLYETTTHVLDARGGTWSDPQRCTTRDAALAQHAATLAVVRAELAARATPWQHN
jgi:hypothetical protein